MTRRLVVASKNSDKVAEVSEILTAIGGFEIVTGLDWPDVDETEDSLEGNAILKAAAAATATGIDALGDDTGLEVDALGGAPGVRTSRYAGPDAGYDENVDKLLRELAGTADRRARFRTVVALVDGAGGSLVAEGVLEGQITEAPRGGGGFGYDPVFESDGRTLAEMDPGEKDRISHRALALRALADRLRK